MTSVKCRCFKKAPQLHNYNNVTIQLITGQGYCSKELNYNMPKCKYFTKVQMLQKCISVPQLITTLLLLNLKTRKQLTAVWQLSECSANICKGMISKQLLQATFGIFENSGELKGRGAVSSSSWRGTKNSTFFPLFDAMRSCRPE